MPKAFYFLKTIPFADDTSLTSIGHDNKHFQQDPCNFLSWLNNLKFNTTASNQDNDDVLFKF